MDYDDEDDQTPIAFINPSKFNFYNLILFMQVNN